MKRFIGWIMALVGAVGTAYGGYYVMAGQSKAYLDPVPVPAMYGGLAGLSLLTIGLLWVRD
jgi:hypothetical protein